MFAQRGYHYILRIFALALIFAHSSCTPLPLDGPYYPSFVTYPALIIPDGPNIDPATDQFAVEDIDIFALNDNMKHLLDEEVIHIESPKQRLEALIDMIFSKNIFKITNDRHRTKTAIETFESGTGNCLSFSITFVAMARYVNLKAKFQDVETLPSWDQFGKIITVNKHISVIAAINEYTEYEVDFYYQDGFTRSDERDKVLSRHRLSDSIEKLSATEIPDYSAIAQYYNNVGSEFLSEGNLPEAFRYYVKALKKDPELSFVWSNIGAVYRRNNQLKAAERAYKQAISINPHEFSAMSNLARLYTLEGRTEEANDLKKEIKFFQNKNPYHHYAMGKRAFKNSQYEESVTHFKRAINRKKDAHQFYYALACAYLKIGDDKNAKKNIDQALAYAPDKATNNYYSRKWNSISDDTCFTN